MGTSKAAQQQQHSRSQPADYVRFIIASAPRTGSNMLAQALDSSPRIRCFREVFNFTLKFIMYDVEGYDNRDPQDMALRERDPVRFLHERIFCSYPQQIGAVGFKYHYGQVWGFPGVLEQLIEDKGLRVLHLRRRNVLRQLISLKIAEMTGVWQAPGMGPTAGAPLTSSLAKARAAIRHPLRAANRLRLALQPPKPTGKAGELKVRITPDELFNYMVQTGLTAEHFDEVFGEHPRLTVYYEDLVDRRVEMFDQVQTFLGVETAPLTIGMRKQNPQPTRQLVANYDELYDAYKNTPEAAFFD